MNWRTVRVDLNIRGAWEMPGDHSSGLRQLPQNTDRLTAAAKQVPPRKECDRGIAGRREEGSGINPQDSLPSRRLGIGHAAGATAPVK
jgi:hypothetical protein